MIDRDARRRQRRRHASAPSSIPTRSRRRRRAAASSRTGCGSVTSPQAGWTVHRRGSRAADGSAQLVLSKPFSTPAQVAGIIARDQRHRTARCVTSPSPATGASSRPRYSAGGTLDLADARDRPDRRSGAGRRAHQPARRRERDRPVAARRRPRLVRVEAGDRPPGAGDHGAAASAARRPRSTRRARCSTRSASCWSSSRWCWSHSRCWCCCGRAGDGVVVRRVVGDPAWERPPRRRAHRTR